MRRRAQGSSRRRQRKWAQDSSWRHRQPGACLRPVAVVNFLWHVQLCGDRHRVGGEVASEVRQLGKSGRSVLQTEETATTKTPSLGAA